MKKRLISLLLVVVMLVTVMCAFGVTAFADDEAEETVSSETSLLQTKALAAAGIVGLAAAAGAISMTLAIGKSVESMARQPEAADKVNSAMMLGLVFIETAIIYALIVAILIIFVL